MVGQDAEAMAFAAAKTSKFVTMPGLPACMTIAVQRGDPSKGPSTLLLKFAPGCVVPWHWHTAAEQLMVVSGRCKAEMKDGKPMAMNPGDFAYLPAKNIHQFTAVTAVMMFDLPAAAFDIHYVDAKGNEVPPEQALKPTAKKGSAAKTSKKQ
jgi:quercetin dioxygenase-like cupin family protein